MKEVKGELIFSELEDWIFKRANHNSAELDIKEGKKAGIPFLYKREIYKDYFKWTGKWKEVPKNCKDSVSKSLSDFERWGLIRFEEGGEKILFTPLYCSILMSEESLQRLKKKAIKETPESEIKLLRINTITGKEKKIGVYDAHIEIGLQNPAMLRYYGIHLFPDFIKFFKEDKEISLNKFIYKKENNI